MSTQNQLQYLQWGRRELCGSFQAYGLFGVNWQPFCILKEIFILPHTHKTSCYDLSRCSTESARVSECISVNLGVWLKHFSDRRYKHSAKRAVWAIINDLKARQVKYLTFSRERLDPMQQMQWKCDNIYLLMMMIKKNWALTVRKYDELHTHYTGLRLLFISKRGSSSWFAALCWQSSWRLVIEHQGFNFQHQDHRCTTAPSLSAKFLIGKGHKSHKKVEKERTEDDAPH